MKPFIFTVSAIGVIASMVTLALSTTASAHVTVKPSEVVTAGYRTFTINVPNEKSISTVKIKLDLPEGLSYVQPTQKAGWDIAIETEGTGEAATVKSITWSGNEVKEGFREEFTFSGQVPEKTTELTWNAYQTYSDGTVVSWNKASTGDGHESEDENSGPFSVTKVVAETDDEIALKNIEQAAVDAEGVARTALYVAIAGVLVGFFGVYVGTRKK
jgi:uncharacterized protein YcnI